MILPSKNGVGCVILFSLIGGGVVCVFLFLFLVTCSTGKEIPKGGLSVGLFFKEAP